MPESNSRFETTRWSLVLRAGRANDRQAASELCTRYWWPVYAFFRSQGAREHEAADITQEFFGDIDRRRDLSRVDPERGRFRSWLCACAKNHLYRYRKGQKALKRNEGQLPSSPAAAIATKATAVTGKADSERSSLTAAPHMEGSVLEPGDLLTPEHDFNRSRALALHARVMGRLRAHYAEIGKLAIFLSLEAVLSGADSERSDWELSQALGMRDEGTLRVARCVMKKQAAPLYRRFLRAEIGETVPDQRDIDHEIRELLVALSQPLGIVERRGAGDVRACSLVERRTG